MLPNSFASNIFSFNQNDSNNNINTSVNYSNINNNLETSKILQTLSNEFSNKSLVNIPITAEDIAKIKEIISQDILKIFDQNKLAQILVDAVNKTEVTNNSSMKLIKTFVQGILNKKQIIINPNGLISNDIINNNNVGQFGVFPQYSNQFIDKKISVYDHLYYDLQPQLGKIIYKNRNPIYGLNFLQDFNQINTICDKIHEYLQSKYKNNPNIFFDQNDLILLNDILRPMYNYLLVQAINKFISDCSTNTNNYTVRFNIIYNSVLLNEPVKDLEIRIQYDNLDNKNLLILTMDCFEQSIAITSFYNNSNYKGRNNLSLFSCFNNM